MSITAYPKINNTVDYLLRLSRMGFRNENSDFSLKDEIFSAKQDLVRDAFYIREIWIYAGVKNALYDDEGFRIYQS